RPARHHRAAARARLPRRLGEELRRTRQLRAGLEGAGGLPGDQLRQARHHPGHGHRHRHHGAHRQGGESPPQGLREAVRELKSARTLSMAKKSSVNKNERRAKLAKQGAARRARLKAVARDKSKTPEERFEAQLKLAELPRNSSATRIRNRCSLTGRPRAFY